MLEFTIEEDGQCILLALAGRLDAVEAPRLRPTIEQLAQRGSVVVVCDLAELTGIDSSGVGALISLFKRLRTAGGDVLIARLGGQPLEIFRLLRLDRVFGIHQTVSAALDAARS